MTVQSLNVILAALCVIGITLSGCDDQTGGPRCGDGTVDTGEDCDGTNLEGEDCTDQGFAAGDLGCNNCTFDTSGCEAGGDCGNDSIDAGEDCDGTELGGEDCTTQGFESGDLACTAACAFDTSDCVAGELCGNDAIDAGEDCDGAELSGEDCTTQGFESGDLGCTGACTFDATGCAAGPDCGNGTLDPNEDCDDGTANSDTTPDACRMNCRNPSCNDSVTDTGEGCDDGAANSDTAPDACRTDCTLADCGDSVVDTGETCDGSDATCATTEDCFLDCTCGLLTTCTALGDSCDPLSPQPAGFVCVEEPGGGTCREECAPMGDTCSMSEICFTIDGITGYCRGDECDSFWINDCAGGWRCVPMTAAIDGCFDVGSGTDGDVCMFHSDCDINSVCTGVCTDIECAPSGAPACTPPATCPSFVVGGDEVDIGVCVVDCTPFSGTECGAGEWCYPDFYVAGDGRCIDEGTAGLGEFCDAGTFCGADLICTLDNACHAICDPAAGEGDPGSCDTGEACSELVDGDGTPLMFGNCSQSCDFHAGTACADPGETCLMGEMIGLTFDDCGELTTTLNHRDDCTAAGLAETDLCGPNAGCIDIGPAILCLYLCATSEGGFGEVHPDCPGGETCEDLVENPDVGVCRFWDV